MVEHTIHQEIDNHHEDFYKVYYNTKLDKCDRINVDTPPNDVQMEVYVTSYNNPLLVSYQAQCFNRFINTQNNTRMIIADTASHLHPENSKETKKICEDNGLGYVLLPHNNFEDARDWSMKLGTSMNWLYRNMIVPRGVEYFGYLDYDMFPIHDDIWNSHGKTLAG